MLVHVSTYMIWNHILLNVHSSMTKWFDQRTIRDCTFLKLSDHMRLERRSRSRHKSDPIDRRSSAASEIEMRKNQDKLVFVPDVGSNVIHCNCRNRRPLETDLMPVSLYLSMCACDVCWSAIYYEANVLHSFVFMFSFSIKRKKKLKSAESIKHLFASYISF